MTINLKIIILIALALVALVIFGPGLVEDEQQRISELRATRGDRLVRSIESHIKREEEQGGGLVGSGRRTRSREDTAQLETKPPAGFSQQYYGAPPATPAAQVPVVQGNGYYPPPAVATAPKAPPAGVSAGNLTLDGTQVAFEGVYVYRLGANGQKEIMPDGVYPLQSGVNLIVRDGRKVIINN